MEEVNDGTCVDTVATIDTTTPTTTPTDTTPQFVKPRRQEDLSDPKWHFCNVLLTADNIRRKRKEKIEDLKIEDPPRVCDYKTKNRDAMRVHLRTKHWIYYCGYCRTRWVGRDGQKQLWKRHMEADCRKPSTVLDKKGNVVPKKKQERLKLKREKYLARKAEKAVGQGVVGQGDKEVVDINTDTDTELIEEE